MTNTIVIVGTLLFGSLVIYSLQIWTDNLDRRVAALKKVAAQRPPQVEPAQGTRRVE